MHLQPAMPTAACAKQPKATRCTGAADSAAHLSAVWAVRFAVDHNLVVCYRLLDVVCLWSKTAMYGQQLLALSWPQHTPGPDLLAQLTGKDLHKSVVAINCAPVRRELTRSWLSWVLQGRVAAVAQA
jgi:hypothetical protein